MSIEYELSNSESKLTNVSKELLDSLGKASATEVIIIRQLLKDTRDLRKDVVELLNSIKKDKK